MAALSGATGAFLAETLADVLKPDEKAEVKSAIEKKMTPKEFEEAFMAKAQASSHWANFVATVAAFGIGQDAGIAYGAAHNVTANNHLTTARTIARAASQALSLNYRAIYAAFAAGGVKGLLDHLQIKSEPDGTYTYNGINYGTWPEAIAAIEILSHGSVDLIRFHLIDLLVWRRETQNYYCLYQNHYIQFLKGLSHQDLRWFG